MHKLPQAQAPHAQAGFSMVEVLVTLIILLVGLLGLAGLMVQSQHSEMESYQRVQALVLLQDMVDRINANRAVASCYAVSSNAGGTPAAGSLGTGTLSGTIAIDPNCVAQATYIPGDTSVPTTTAFCTAAGTCTYRCSLTAGGITAATCPDAVSGPIVKGLAAARATQAGPIALADLRAWNDLLNGAAETSGGNNAGAMVGARGCVSYDNTQLLPELDPKTGLPTGNDLTGTGVYTVTVAWQGMSDTFAPPAALGCGKDQYGLETKRRVVSLTFRLASLM